MGIPEALAASAPWPPSVREALRTSAAGDSVSGRSLSMPAAETFASRAVAAAVAAVHPVSAVIGVGDCAPAVSVARAGTSSNPQMRAVVSVGTSSGVPPPWLPVHVKRHLNLGADELSHPRLLPSVRLEVVQAQLFPLELAVPEQCWAELEAAIALGAGHDVD